MFGWLKKVGGAFKKLGKATPKIVRNPGFRVGLTFLGVPPGVIELVVPIVETVEHARFGKFRKAYKAAQPILAKHGITRRSDINLIIELALAIAEGRMETEKRW